MRLGGDDGPFFFSCPGRKPHERCELGPILLCMGLFSRFCVWAPRCTAHSVSKTRVNALMRRCAASGTRDRWCFALTANRSNSNASCSSDGSEKLRRTGYPLEPVIERPFGRPVGG